RNTRVGSVSLQRGKPIVLALLTICRTAGHDDEAAAGLQRFFRNPLRDFLFQLRWPARRPGLELPTSIGSTEPIVRDPGLARPPVAPIVFGVAFSVDADRIHRASAPIRLSPQELAH